MSRILVLGSNGLLGQKIIRLLHKKKIHFLAASKSENKISSIQDFDFMQLDITNKSAVSKIAKEYQPAIIINAAGMTNVDECDLNKNECWDVNVNATKNLVEIANKIAAHYLQVSTDFVFSGNKGPYCETDKPDPANYYGESKHAGEKLVMENCTNWSIVRTVLVYGITENMSRSNIVLWVKNSLEAGKKIRVVNDQFRTPTLAEDLAMGCLLVAQKNANGIFHISGKDMMSIYDIAISVARFFNLDESLISPISSDELGEKAKRPPVTGFIIDKSKKELGYAPHSFVKGLEILKNQMGAD